MIEFLFFSVAALLSGMLSFMAPCTLPLLPAYFGYAGTSDRKETVRNTFYFMLGLAGMFTLLGVLAGSLGRFALNYKRELMLASAVFLVIFGVLSVIGKGIKLTKMRMNYKRSRIGSIIFGAFFGMIWSGCIGPVLGFMLVLAANTGTAFTGGLLLFIHAIGLLLPLLFFSLYLSKLPQNGKFWKFMKGKLYHFKMFGKEYYIHSTNLMSGVLFIVLGTLLYLEAMFGVTKFLFPDLTNWVFTIQNKIVEVFNLR